MERRRAIAISAATVATTLAAAAAVAANFGLLRLGPGPSTPLGQLDAGRPPAATASPTPNQPAPNPPVRYEDIFVRVPTASPATTTPPSGSAPAVEGIVDAAGAGAGNGDAVGGRDSDGHEASEHGPGQDRGGDPEEDD